MMERAHAEVVRGPRADAGELDRRRDERVEVMAIEIELAAGDRRRDALDRRGARAGQAELREPIDGTARDLRRGREAKAVLVKRAELHREPPGERRRGGDRHLLADHRADRRLERIDRTWDAKSGTSFDETCEQRVL